MSWDSPSSIYDCITIVWALLDDPLELQSCARLPFPGIFEAVLTNVSMHPISVLRVFWARAPKFSAGHLSLP